MRVSGLTITDLPRILFGSPPRASTPSDIRRFSSSFTGAGLVLVLLCLAVYLPGLWSIPPVDRDESRFAQASRQMYESGDYIVPRIQDRPRLNKPPLIYWLQCASIATFGDREGQYPNANIWVFRVPSVLCAIAAVLLTWRLGLRLFDPRAAFLAAALLAVCPMVVWDAHQARADQLLLATTTATMFCLFAVWKSSSCFFAPTGRRPVATGEAQPANAGEAQPVDIEHRDFSAPEGRRNSDAVDAPTSHSVRNAQTPVLLPILFWLCLSAGILTKGPITPLIAALTALSLSAVTRNWRWLLALRPLLGLIIICITVGPWVYAVARRVGWSVYMDEVFAETLGRSAEPKEGHWGPPGYHLVLLVVLFWPGVLLTAAALQRAFTSNRPGFWHHFTRKRPPTPTTFLLCWIAPSWLLFELILTKLPHYTLPMYPAIALLTARFVLRASALRTTVAAAHRSRIGVMVWATIGIAIIGLTAVALLATDPGRIDLSEVVFYFAILFVTLCFILIAARMAWGSQPLRCTAFAVAGSIGIVWTLLQGALPTNALLPGGSTPYIMLQINQLRQRHDNDHSIASTYHQDSLLFWTRGRAVRIEHEDVDQWLAHNPSGICVVHSRGGPQWVELGFDVAGNAHTHYLAGFFKAVTRKSATP